MANVGYIPLYRKLRDNFLWNEKRALTKAEAWIDILMEARHCEAPKEVVLGSTVLRCHYSQSLKSIRTWAKRWKWSEKKVRNFFKVLKECSMIETKNEGVTTRLTVCNYGKYDPKRQPEDAERTHTGHSVDADETQQGHTNNNVNNEKNEKNGKKGSPPFNFSSYKSFYEMECAKADAAFEEASRKFLADGAK